MPRQKGFKHSEEAKRNMRKSALGRKFTEEHKKKLSDSMKGRKAWNKGIPHSEETRKKISIKTKQLQSGNCGKKGKNNASWKGGLTAKNLLFRNSQEYKEWREAVFKRDNYTCQRCGKVGGKLEAHHIKSFSKYPKLRLQLRNGKTLCKTPCHKIEHKK